MGQYFPVVIDSIRKNPANAKTGVFKFYFLDKEGTIYDKDLFKAVANGIEIDIQAHADNKQNREETTIDI
jgi:hypothetical protein